MGMVFLPILLGLSLAAAPKPCDGPALPLKFVGAYRHQNPSPDGQWNRGIYTNVQFRYISDEPLDDAIAAYLKETGDKPQTKRRMSSGHIGEVSFTDYGAVWGRKIGSVHQTVVIRDVHDAADGPHRQTWVEISESVQPTAPLPARWYRGAISPTPPAPLVEMPFLNGRKADTVCFTSFEGLMSSAGIRFTEKDALCYGAYLDEPYKAVLKRVEEWAVKNGYAKTQWGSYFRAGSGCFEFTLQEQRRGDGRPGTVAGMYVSEKKAEHPIEHIKN
jgi:hypothetical protein